MTTIAPLPSHRFDRSLLGAGPLRGRVATVFTHAAIARLEPGGSLLTLLHPSRELVPFGVAIPWDQAPLTMGDAVRLTDRALLIGSAQLVLEGEGTALGLVATPFSLEILKVHLPISMSFARRGRPDIEKRALQRADNSLRQVVLALSSGLSSPADLTGA
ncbi:MAG: hypothetical protein HY901_00105, partial [Deltaproteobacteria bacterium]|nr:hypothetical protein [Deltaproteobacteria bacterium]